MKNLTNKYTVYKYCISNSPWGRPATPGTVYAAECEAAGVWIWPHTCKPGSQNPAQYRCKCSGRFLSSPDSSRNTESASGGTSVKRKIKMLWRIYLSNEYCNSSMCLKGPVVHVKYRWGKEIMLTTYNLNDVLDASDKYLIILLFIINQIHLTPQSSYLSTLCFRYWMENILIL